MSDCARSESFQRSGSDDCSSSWASCCCLPAKSKTHHEVGGAGGECLEGITNIVHSLSLKLVVRRRPSEFYQTPLGPIPHPTGTAAVPAARPKGPLRGHHNPSRLLALRTGRRAGGGPSGAVPVTDPLTLALGAHYPRSDDLLAP